MHKSTLIAVAYGLPAMAMYAVHAVFVTYHVDLFLNVYGLSRAWLLAGELWILVVSSFNEPLFGYVMARSHGYRRHLTAISTGGALLALASLLPFFPLWSLDASPLALGVHFVLSVYLYDAVLAYVQLAHSSLLADLTSVAAERERCNLFAALLGAVGSSSVFVGHFFWDREDLFEFRLFCLVLACCSAAAFYASAELCERQAGFAKKGDDSSGLQHHQQQQQQQQRNVIVNYGSYGALGRTPLRLFLRQIRTHANLWLFNVVNLLQVFNCHFNSNFLPIFVRAFVGVHAPPIVGSLVLGLAASLPHATVVLLTGVVARVGAARVVRGVILVRVVFALLALLALRPLADADSALSGGTLQLLAVLAALYLTTNKMLGEAVCRHTNLILSDVIDEDSVIHGRHASESTLIHGVAFFISKPGQSIAPIVGMLCLRDAVAESPEYNERLFLMMCGIPLLCTVVQSLLWLRYDLTGTRLAQVRKQLRFRPQI